MVVSFNFSICLFCAATRWVIPHWVLCRFFTLFPSISLFCALVSWFDVCDSYVFLCLYCWSSYFCTVSYLFVLCSETAGRFQFSKGDWVWALKHVESHYASHKSGTLDLFCVFVFVLLLVYLCLLSFFVHCIILIV